jgi:beta-carotene 3-hydroxylase
MDNWVIYALVMLITFFATELAAWAMHKYVMHGPLWFLHYDHHNKKKGFFEKNDTFFLIFAIPSWLCIMFGSLNNNMIMWSIGIGIAIYGVVYAIVHEIFIHQRIKWLRTTNVLYFKALRRAHKMHHKHLGKEDGESFGMIIIGWKYIREELELARKKRKQKSLA